MHIFLVFTMFTKRSYEMTVNSYSSNGSEITLRKNSGPGHLIPFMLVVLFHVCVQATGKLSAQKLYISSCLLMVLCVIYSLGKIHTESLLILSSIGVMFKQSSHLSTKTTFYDVTTIKDIVLLEAISKQSVIFQLVLLPKPHSSCHNSQQIHPLFQSFHPRLEDLKTAYRQLQEKLILLLRDS